MRIHFEKLILCFSKAPSILKLFKNAKMIAASAITFEITEGPRLTQILGLGKNRVT